MKEDLEIERKYLLKYNPLNLGEFDNLLRITQLYLPKDENGYTVRYRYVTDTNDNVRYIKTLKKYVTDFTREEIETDITKGEYEEAEKKAVSEISKLRYELIDGDLTWQIDNFINIKMVVAEVELPSENHTFDIPEHIENAIVAEVTGVEGFSNESLALFLE
jgi:CYTH domain-containing protein